MFSGCIVPSYSRETGLKNIDQEPTPSAGKNTGVVYVVYGNVALQPYLLVWVFPRSLVFICYERCVFREGDKNYCKDHGLSLS